MAINLSNVYRGDPRNLINYGKPITAQNPKRSVSADNPNYATAAITLFLRDLQKDFGQKIISNSYVYNNRKNPSGLPVPPGRFGSGIRGSSAPTGVKVAVGNPVFSIPTLGQGAPLSGSVLRFNDYSFSDLPTFNRSGLQASLTHPMISVDVSSASIPQSVVMGQYQFDSVNNTTQTNDEPCPYSAFCWSSDLRTTPPQEEVQYSNRTSSALFPTSTCLTAIRPTLLDGISSDVFSGREKGPIPSIPGASQPAKFRTAPLPNRHNFGATGGQFGITTNIQAHNIEQINIPMFIR